MTEQEINSWLKERCEFMSRIGKLEGMLIGITCWPEVPQELKNRILEFLEEEKRKNSHVSN